MPPSKEPSKEEIVAQWTAIMAKRGGLLWGFCPEPRRRLHLRACWLLGYQEPLPYTARTEQQWVEYEQCGYGPDELRDVIRYRERMRQSHKVSYGRGLSALLADMGAFAEQLALSRKRQQAARPDTIETVQALPEGGERRVEIPFPVTIPESISREQALAQIAEWKEKRKAMLAGASSSSAHTQDTLP